MITSVTQSRYCFTILYRVWNYPSSHYQNGNTCIQHEIKEFTTLAHVAGSENGFWCEWWWLNSTSLRAQRPNLDWDFIAASLFLLTCIHVGYVCTPHIRERKEHLSDWRNKTARALPTQTTSGVRCLELRSETIRGPSSSLVRPVVTAQDPGFVGCHWWLWKTNPQRYPDSRQPSLKLVLSILGLVEGFSLFWFFKPSGVSSVNTLSSLA